MLLNLMQRLFFAIVFLQLGVLHAAGDSLYAKLLLGSLEYRQPQMVSSHYLRPQAALLKVLTSKKIAEKAVEQCYRDQSIAPENSRVISEANMCVKAFRVQKVVNDTAWLALGETGITSFLPSLFLLNLMRVYQEDGMRFAFDANRKSTDSLDKLLDKEYMYFRYLSDTLLSFSGTPEFTVAAKQLFASLLDTIAMMKQDVAALGADSIRVRSIFRDIDTLTAQVAYFYRDTTNKFYARQLPECNRMVFGLETVLDRAAINLIVVSEIKPVTALDTHYLSLQSALVVTIIEQQLERSTWDRIIMVSDSYVLPIQGKDFNRVLKRYNSRKKRYNQLLLQKSRLAIALASIQPTGKIICLPSATPCK